MRSNIGDRLKAARKKLRLSQAGAAEKWQINKRTLQGYEAGYHSPRGPALRWLEQMLTGVEKKKR